MCRSLRNVWSSPFDLHARRDVVEIEGGQLLPAVLVAGVRADGMTSDELYDDAIAILRWGTTQQECSASLTPDHCRIVLDVIGERWRGATSVERFVKGEHRGDKPQYEKPTVRELIPTHISIDAKPSTPSTRLIHACAGGTYVAGNCRACQATIEPDEVETAKAARVVRMIDGKHGITSQGRLVKVANDGATEEIPADEPTFLFRGRDHLAVNVLYDYLERAKQDGCTEEHLDGINSAIIVFQRFQYEHPERMKQPGITRGRL